MNKDAYPSLFPNQPTPAPIRKKPIDRLAAQIKIDSDKDSLNMLKDFMIKVPKILQKPWQITENDNKISIYKCNFNSCPPSMEFCINVYSNLTLDIWNNLKKYDLNLFSDILGSNKLCNSLSKVTNLIIFLDSLGDTSCSNEDKLSYALKLLDEYSNVSPHNSKVSFFY